MSVANVIPKESLSDWERWEMEPFSRPQNASPADRLPTAEQLEQVHRQAHAEGYRAGYVAGEARAKTEAAQLAALLKSARASLVQVEEQFAQNILELAFAVARSVIRTAYDEKPELLTPLIREAIAESPARTGHGRLLLHPDDAELFETLAPALLSQSAGWEIARDPKIARGGCRVQTPLGEVDATIETRWRRVAAALGRDIAWSSGDSESATSEQPDD